MWFGRGRHAATDGQRRRTGNQRREHLERLGRAVGARPGFKCRVGEEGGVHALHVEKGGTSLEVGCDFRDGRWWFTWPGDGRAIVPVAALYGAVRVIVQELGGARA
ncbi:hypothetical protein [Actinomadura rugatobispora]|uniref:DUF3024 domain-containing protein n=1 Tax=Actinomadura rugatobispora TaxID=1994 RepID=A0ABW1A3X2_9ACTN|nr:hypothetical protein GCM10010200_045470 [Actinomadura rugatobispora]